jgi:predicted glycosyltransferase
VPKEPLDGANLIAACDLVVSAGGTINREAAALGVPAASIYQGQWAAVDEHLVQEGRLLRISTVSGFKGVRLEKKTVSHPRAATKVIDEVVSFILE